MLKQRGGGEGRRAPRFKIGKRIGSRRKVSSEKKSLPPLKTVIKAIKVDHAENSSSIMMDVLAERESILSSDSTVCESIIDDKEEEELQMVRVDAIVQQDEDFSVSLQTWRKYRFTEFVFAHSTSYSTTVVSTTMLYAHILRSYIWQCMMSTHWFIRTKCRHCLVQVSQYPRWPSRRQCTLLLFP